MFATLHVEKNRPLVYKYDDLYKASRRVALKAALQGRSMRASRRVGLAPARTLTPGFDGRWARNPSTELRKSWVTRFGGPTTTRYCTVGFGVSGIASR